MYLVKTPFWLRWLYPSLTWQIPGKEKTIYLTFDDGPHPDATPFVLDQLGKYGAKATFFCIGKNVAVHPDIYQRILHEGHSTGNHTYHHLNGWKVTDEQYLNDIAACQELVQSPLFRPPYGRIRRSQIKKLNDSFLTPNSPLQTIMWSVLSGDFDTLLTPEACLSYVLYHTRPGAIIVFHDSEKAWERMRFALPKVLEHFTNEGYTFKAIPMKD